MSQARLKGPVRQRAFLCPRLAVRDNKIRVPRAAFRTAQQPRPIGNGHAGAVLRDLGGNIWIGLMVAAIAPAIGVAVVSRR